MSKQLASYPSREEVDRFLTLKAVEKRVGIGKTRIYELMAQQKFPLPIKPGGWRNMWIASEVEAFIEKLMAARPTSIIERR